MHFLLGAFGSSGDVHPMVGIGIALRARGHEVTVLTSSYFEPLIRKAGLNFVDPAPEIDYRQSLENPDLWHPVRGSRALMKLMTDAIRPVFETVVRLNVPGKTVFVATSLGLGARIAQETHGVALATVHLSPCFFRSRTDGPKFYGLVRPEWLPNFLKDLQYDLLDVIGIDRRLGPAINELLKKHGRPQARSVLGSWFHSPDLVLALFPDWFTSAKPDWPPQTVLTGFPLYDERDVVEPPRAVEEFVKAGPPPIVFTPGSANIQLQAGKFFQAACDACNILGRRGILLTRFPDQLPRELPKNIRHFDFVPFSWLLPKAAAIVHHGGIGTIGQGLAAGIPQLVMPMNFDQHDNAARLTRLGCGTSLPPRLFRGWPVATALKELLSSPKVTAACLQAAQRVQQMRPLDTICDALESLAARKQAQVASTVAEA